MSAEQMHPEGAPDAATPANVLPFRQRRPGITSDEIIHRRRWGSTLGFAGLAGAMALAGFAVAHHRPQPVRWCIEGHVASELGFTSAVVDANNIYGLQLTQHDTDQIGGGVARRHPGAVPEPNDPVALGLDARRHVVSADAGSCGTVYPGMPELPGPGTPPTPAGTTTPR